MLSPINQECDTMGENQFDPIHQQKDYILDSLDAEPVGYGNLQRECPNQMATPAIRVEYEMQNEAQNW